MAETNKLSPEQRAELFERVAAGDSYASIARDYDVTLEAISYHARKVWGPKEKRKILPAQSREIAERFARGETATSLAREFGVGLTTARTHIEKQTGKKPGRNRRSIGVNPPLAPCDLAYLAAIVDGEGCIAENRSRSHQGWQVSITNTSEDLRHSLSGLGGRFYFPKRDRSTRKGKELREQVWVWKIASAWDVHRFLSTIEPYMRIKRQKALQTIAAIEKKHGPPPRMKCEHLRDASTYLSETLTQAAQGLTTEEPSRPPLRAGQLSMGV